MLSCSSTSSTVNTPSGRGLYSQGGKGTLSYIVYAAYAVQQPRALLVLAYMCVVCTHVCYVHTYHHIPRKRIRPTNNPPWFSQEIKRLINARQHSYRRLKRYQTEPHRREHIHACRAVKRTIKSTKRN
ncbi:hypothetical protein FHG87_022501 [Trinorchestia longiramus]|nr:hypothetical protein FHG87_022501 [Trinorchestia longiramus]